MAQRGISRSSVLSGAAIAGDAELIRLNGKPYRIDLGSYRGKDVTDFAPRASTPGGDTKFSELNLYQPVTFTDWRHGFGFHWHTDVSGYQRTTGFVDTRQANLAMLNSMPVRAATVLAGYVYGISHDTTKVLVGAKVSGSSVLTATGGSTTTVVKAAAGWTTNYYKDMIVSIVAGTGIGQHRTIVSNDATTLTVTPAFDTAPVNGSTFAIYYRVLYYHTRPGTFVLANGFRNETINFIYNNGTYDFIGVDGGYIYRTTDLTTISPAVTPYVYNSVDPGGGFSTTKLKATTPAGSLPWTGDQWINYLVIATSATGIVSSSRVTTNTTDTLTLDVALSFTPDTDTTFIITNWIRCGNTAANSKDYSWLVAHNGFLFAGKDGTNQVYYDSTADAKSSSIDLSKLEGDPGDDPACILVGPPGREVKGAVAYNGDLFFFRDDAVYKMAADRGSASRVLDFTDQVSPHNFTGYAVYNGQLVFNIRNHLYSWNGVRMSDITPPRITDTFPFATYGAFSNMVVIGSNLWMYAADTAGANSYAAILCWDGVGWHKMVDGLPAQDDMSFFYSASNPIFINRIYYDPVGPSLLFSNIGSSTLTYQYVLTFDPRSDFPYNSFPRIGGADWYTGENAILTSKIDAGYRRILKSTPSILVEGSNLGSGQYFLIYFSRDGEAFLPWGGTDGTTNKVNATGVTELRNPATGLTGAGTYNTIQYYYLQFKILFCTNSSTQSPILNGLHVRLIMRPVTSYGYSFNVIAEPPATELGMGYMDDRSPYQIVSDLRTARDSAAPVAFVDVFEDTHYVYVTAINELAIQHNEDEMANGKPAVEHAIQVNLITVDGKRYA